MHNDEYATSDLWFSAAMVARQPHTLIDVVWNREKNQADFIFEDDGTMEESFRQYWNRDLSVDANAMYQAYRMLRARVAAVSKR